MSRMYGRLAALPDQAEPLQRARLLAALSVGSEIIQLRHVAPRLGVDLRSSTPRSRPSRRETVRSPSRGCISSTSRIASDPDAAPETAIALRARGRILVISEALAEHASYFDAGALA